VGSIGRTADETQIAVAMDRPQTEQERYGGAKMKLRAGTIFKEIWKRCDPGKRAIPSISSFSRTGIKSKVISSVMIE
jgi:hypothetical protein